MTSQTFELLHRQRDPNSVITGVVDAIIEAERKFTIADSLRTIFYDLNARTWGDRPGELTDIALRREWADRGFRLTFEMENYSRGCYMGTTTSHLVVSDELVRLYETWQFEDDGYETDEAFQQALNKYTTERVQSLMDTERGLRAVEAADAEDLAQANFEALSHTDPVLDELFNKVMDAYTLPDQPGLHEALDKFFEAIIQRDTALALSYSHRLLAVEKVRFKIDDVPSFRAFTKHYAGLIVG